MCMGFPAWFVFCTSCSAWPIEFQVGGVGRLEHQFLLVSRVGVALSLVP